MTGGKSKNGKVGRKETSTRQEVIISRRGAAAEEK